MGLLGYSQGEVGGKPCRELILQASPRKQSKSGPRLGGEGFLENYEMPPGRHPDPYLLSPDYPEVRKSGGRAFSPARDGSLEEELLRSERLSARGRMAAHISHEIKNPLMLIGGFARQVEISRNLKDESRSFDGHGWSSPKWAAMPNPNPKSPWGPQRLCRNLPAPGTGHPGKA